LTSAPSIRSVEPVIQLTSEDLSELAPLNRLERDEGFGRIVARDHDHAL
jgi:hypothetical protein